MRIISRFSPLQFLSETIYNDPWWGWFVLWQFSDVCCLGLSRWRALLTFTTLLLQCKLFLSSIVSFSWWCDVGRCRATRACPRDRLQKYSYPLNPHNSHLILADCGVRDKAKHEVGMRCDIETFISHSNGLNTPLVLILGLSTNSQSYFPLLVYAYHLTEQWTQHSSSTHSRSVH